MPHEPRDCDLRNDEHWTVGQAHDLHGSLAVHEPTEGVMAPRANHDHAGPAIVGDVDDRPRARSFEHVDAVPSSRPSGGERASPPCVRISRSAPRRSIAPGGGAPAERASASFFSRTLMTCISRSSRCASQCATASAESEPSNGFAASRTGPSCVSLAPSWGRGVVRFAVASISSPVRRRLRLRS